MGEKDIRTKLGRHLDRHCPMTEECHVVYFMVEVRKFCERTGYKDELLTFYCDWALHSRKSRPVDRLTRIVEDTYVGLKAHLESGTANEIFGNFCRMTELRQSIRSWLKHANLPSPLVDSERNWTAFRVLLANVLADQEMVTKDSPNVRSIHFQSADGTCLIRFRVPIGRHEGYRGKK